MSYIQGWEPMMPVNRHCSAKPYHGYSRDGLADLVDPVPMSSTGTQTVTPLVSQVCLCSTALLIPSSDIAIRVVYNSTDELWSNGISMRYYHLVTPRYDVPC